MIEEVYEMKNVSTIKSVLFDCWDTLIEFHCENPYWNIQSLMNHCQNKSEVDFDDVFHFSENYFKQYYRSHLDYEVSVKSILALFVDSFSIQLDCSLEQCSHEILCELSPRPVNGILDFLSFLEERKITYGCLSNTIYDEKDTLDVLQKVLHRPFRFLLASSSVSVKKPNPLFFQVGAKKMGADLSSSMYIGDKLYQDAYGSMKSGFHSSVFLDWKLQKEKQERELLEIHHVESFDHIYVTSYAQLKKRFEND